MKLRAITFAVLALLFLVACESRTSSSSTDYTDRLQKLKLLVAKTSIGPNGDYWLVKSTFLGSDPVALIFGFPDNYAFCQELAEAQNKLYPGASVACQRAQQ